MARRKLKRKKAMYQTEGIVPPPLNPPILGGFEPANLATAISNVPPMPEPGNVLDTATRGKTTTPQLPPLKKTPSLYELYTKAGVNIPEGYMDASDEDIKQRFGTAYNLKTQLMRGGFLSEPSVFDLDND